MERTTIYKQVPGADIEPGWWAVIDPPWWDAGDRQQWLGPFANRREAEKAARQALRAAAA